MLSLTALYIFQRKIREACFALRCVAFRLLHAGINPTHGYINGCLQKKSSSPTPATPLIILINMKTTIILQRGLPSSPRLQRLPCESLSHKIILFFGASRAAALASACVRLHIIKLALRAARGSSRACFWSRLAPLTLPEGSRRLAPGWARERVMEAATVWGCPAGGQRLACWSNYRSKKKERNVHEEDVWALETK